MTSREIVKNTIEFKNTGRIPVSLPEEYVNDIAEVTMNPHVDARPSNKKDEWGVYWENIGTCNLGEAKDSPIKSWEDYSKLNIPDVQDPKRWEKLSGENIDIKDKFIIGSGISIYERAHFLRGLENLWMDIYTNPVELGKLLDILVDMNISAIDKYAEHGIDGYICCDDWGLQNSLMISPDKWREFWKPKYARMYNHCHKHNIKTFLHSCGYIVDILDDLIECGLDVIQMDQQQNMGLDLLSNRFKGKITFWCPVDIQNMMCAGSIKDIKKYCHELVNKLGMEKGGFIAKWYPDRIGAGHSEEAVKAMCEEFMKISEKINE